MIASSALVLSLILLSGAAFVVSLLHWVVLLSFVCSGAGFPFGRFCFALLHSDGAASLLLIVGGGTLPHCG